MTSCPVCTVMADLDVRLHPKEAVSRVVCPRCGVFEIESIAWNAFISHPSIELARNRYLLSGRARVATSNEVIVRFGLDDFGHAERGEIPEPSIDEKVRLMLRWFESKTTKHGEFVTPVSTNDYPAAYCRDQSEWTALIWDLVKEEYLQTDGGQQFRITLAGKRMLGQHSPAPSAPSYPPVLETQPKESPVSTVPTHFGQYQGDVDRFMKDGAFEDSVFVMMKFPTPGVKPYVRDMLDTIFKTIRDELSRYGLNARRADDKTYATGRQLWDNLCVYMLGCKYGLAVLEDRSGEDFNPNVALEYGFMRALGRDAVLLKERAFKYIRADVLATIPKEFSIEANFDVDEGSLRAAIEEWMVDLDRPAKRRR